MSDVISAWVDEDEMRRLAESLLSRPYGDDLNRLEVNFGSQFEGFASDLPPEMPQAQAQAPIAKQQPLPPVEAAAKVPTAIEPISVAPSPEPKPEVAAELKSEPPVVSPSGPPQSVVRAAVQFLKKAQADGRAGGVIREPRASPPLPSSPPSQDTEVSFSGPTQPEPRPIHSPFRRLSEVEAEAEAIDEAATEQSQSPLPVGNVVTSNLKRPPIPSGDDPILARVTQFGKWLKGPVGVRNFFVSNSEGKILIDELANPKLVQVARSLAGASGGSGGEVGSLHVRIGEDSILEVVPTPSQFGILILGLIVEHPLPEELIREIRLGLEEVANARLIKAQVRER